MATLEEKVDRLVVDVSDIKVALKGYNSHDGLCNHVNRIDEDFYLLRRRIYIIAAFIVGGGGLGIGSYELVRLATGG